jgi:Phasin protein
MVRGISAFGEEMAGPTRSGVDLAARAATEMLEVKTVSDAFRVNARFARNSFDSFLDGSAKLSGLGVRLAAESSRPILTQWGQGWIEVARLAL